MTTPNKPPKPSTPSSNPRGAGRPSRPETLDALREKGERETLKLCAELRRKIEVVAEKIMTKIEEPGAPLKDLTTSLDTLNRSGKTAAEMSAILRRAKIGEGEGGSASPVSAEDLLRSLEKEMR